MLKFICYAAKSCNAVVKSFKSIICFKGFPGFGILNKNIANVIVFNIYAIDFCIFLTELLGLSLRFI